MSIRASPVGYVEALTKIDSDVNWKYRKDPIYEYIRTRKKAAYDDIRVDDSSMSVLASAKIIEAKDYYWKGIWKENPEWDRVGITTLFTFYWDITIETINFAKYLVKDVKNLMVGGVLASIQPKEIEAATGIKPQVYTSPVPEIYAFFSACSCTAAKFNRSAVTLK